MRWKIGILLVSAHGIMLVGRGPPRACRTAASL